MADVAVPTPIINPVFPPKTPASIIQAYVNNVGCVCAAGDSACSNCLTVGPEHLLENRDASALGAIIAIPIIAFVVTVLRTYARAVILKRIGSDDILALATFLLYIPFQVLSIVLIQMGSGRHLAYIQFVIAQSNDAVNQTERLDFIAHILYTTALLLCRLSGIAFYIRLLNRSKTWQITICKAGAFLLCLGYVPQIVLLIVHCRPVTSLWPYGWQNEANNYTCLAWGAVYVTNSGISLVCDFLLLGIAAALIANWNIGSRQKLMLLPILFPGILVIGISIVRLWLVTQGQWQADQSWWYDPQMAIENTEIGLTLIALCVPGLKPLVVKVWETRSTYYGRRRRASIKSEDSRIGLGRLQNTNAKKNSGDRKNDNKGNLMGPDGSPGSEFKMKAMTAESREVSDRDSSGSEGMKVPSQWQRSMV